MNSKLWKARMKVSDIKARWIKACVVSNTKSRVQTTVCESILFKGMWLWLHLIRIVFTSHQNWAHYQKRYKNNRKNKKKRDVGMACQKVHKQCGYKSEAKYTKSCLYIFTLLWKDWLYLLSLLYPSLFGYFFRHHSNISYDFSSSYSGGKDMLSALR